MAKDTTNTETASPAAPAAPQASAKPKRAKRATHEYLGPDGKTFVDDEEQAVGIYYKDEATGDEFRYQIPGAKPGSVQTMLALFGAKTLATNSASGNRNAQNGPTGTDVEAITSRFGELADGQWDVRGEGTKRGPKYDLNILASCIAELVSAKTGKTQDVSKVREKLEDDMKYRRGAYANTEVQAAYRKATGQAAPDVVGLAV